jgi:hypothetical protein
MKLADEQLNKISLQVGEKIKKCIECIQISGAIGCALVFENKLFKNIVTDGDIRRALLEGLGLEDTIQAVLDIKSRSKRSGPITASLSTSYEERKLLFEQYSLRQLILLGDDQMPASVIDHGSMNYHPPFVNKGFSALIMAGGFGTRLKPYTESTPKPMLPINGRPMLEITIESLRSFGANKIFLSTHYLPNVIKDYFGDGDAFGIPVEYVHEQIPLGTGGALKLLPKDDLTENLLIIKMDNTTMKGFAMFGTFCFKS